jgi:hypothetical protein
MQALIPGGTAGRGVAHRAALARHVVPAQRGRPGRRRLRPPAGWPALAGLLLGLLAIGPGLARGFVLSYDMVFVPGPPFSSALLGLVGGPARPVPSDAVVYLASRVVPADILQKLILLSIFLLACSGAAALLGRCWQERTGERPPPLACLAAGVYYAWNPFVAERLVMGQWAMLLGYGSGGAGWCWRCFRPLSAGSRGWSSLGWPPRRPRSPAAPAAASGRAGSLLPSPRARC